MAVKANQMILVENDTKNLTLNFGEDRTDCVVVMNIKYPDQIKIVPCIPIDESLGVYTTQFVAGDLIAGGPFNYEFQVTYPSGEIETHNRVDVNGVKGKLLELIIDEEIN